MLELHDYNVKFWTHCPIRAWRTHKTAVSPSEGRFPFLVPVLYVAFFQRPYLKTEDGIGLFLGQNRSVTCSFNFCPKSFRATPNTMVHGSIRIEFDAIEELPF